MFGLLSELKQRETSHPAEMGKRWCYSWNVIINVHREKNNMSVANRGNLQQLMPP